MNWNQVTRVGHRWLSILFTVAVIVVTIVAVGVEAPAEWVYFLPLPPLLLLMVTGLYLFVLPYAAKWRKRSG